MLLEYLAAIRLTLTEGHRLHTRPLQPETEPANATEQIKNPH